MADRNNTYMSKEVGVDQTVGVRDVSCGVVRDKGKKRGMDSTSTKAAYTPNHTNA